MKKSIVKNISLSGMFLALGIILPFFTGQIPEIGKMLSPMHIPVFLCGFFCGPISGFAVGFIMPLLRFALFSMPPIFPEGAAMALELAVYGALVGVLYKAMPKKTVFIYLSLICAMLAGRVVWGAARFLLAGLAGSEFSFSMFLAGAFINALPGIILHIVLVPAVVMSVNSMRKAANARVL